MKTPKIYTLKNTYTQFEVERLKPLVVKEGIVPLTADLQMLKLTETKPAYFFFFFFATVVFISSHPNNMLAD